jgi:hypothetical protein
MFVLADIVLGIRSVGREAGQRVIPLVVSLIFALRVARVLTTLQPALPKTVMGTKLSRME